MDDVHDSSALWRLTLEYSPVGMTLVDLDGTLLLVNRALSEMLGYDVETLTRRDFQQITHPDDLDTDLRHFHQALDGEIDSYRLRKRYLHADGHVVWGDLSVAIVRGPEREPLYFISQILDVSEQHEFEQRLQAAKAEIEHERNALEAIFETVTVGLLLIDRDGHYERMNRRHEETMRLPFPEGHRGAAGQLGHVYQVDGKTLMTREEMPSYRAAQGEEFDDYTYWVGSDPLTRAAFSTSARQVRGPGGERLGAALAYQEITEVMRAMQVKDEFVSSVSHELRTPLTSVLGHLEMLAEEDLPPSVAAQLEVVRRNAARLGALVADLLLVAQVGEGGLRLQRRTVDLSALIREAVEAARPTAEKAEVRVDAVVPDRLPARVDEQRIRQVLDNLVSNAVKYSVVGGRATVSLRQRPDTVEIEVSDTGIGIPADEIEQVFSRFFRGGHALSQHISGTGLGLNIVSSIVAAHDGTVSLESEVGVGSTFRVTLPHRSG
ncbi:PAS domain-containing sensor histidine kinase [Nocardioides sp. W7]|uniref:PAS domain-containing sensor histidine kinase n=1 Tax=Nocardioides sp. W7 TaxID=2931390 RepID=UPI001FD09B40|nr:PAS domain-containing sensor histidine kinase [Nocardioides sp. W7]